MDTELTQVLGDLNRAFADFRRSNNAEIATLKAKVIDLENAGARAASGILAPTTGVRAEALAAWKAFLRGGNAEAMMQFARPEAAATTQVGPNTGYLVPQEVAAGIEKLQRDFSPLRQIARRYEANTDKPEFLVRTRDATANWVGETENRNDTENDKVAVVTVPLGELEAMPSISQRMLDDSMFPADEFIQTSVAEVFAEKEGAAFVSGNGINKPRGFLTYDVSTSADATRAFGTIQYRKTGAAGAFVAAPNGGDCLISLVHDLRPAYRQGESVAWLMSSSTLAQVRLLKDSNGQFLLRPGIEKGEPDRLLGYPVTVDENMPAIANNSYSIAFANWARAYVIVDHITGVRTLRDPFTAKPNVRFYTTKREGGALLNSEAIKLLQFAA